LILFVLREIYNSGHVWVHFFIQAKEHVGEDWSDFIEQNGTLEDFENYYGEFNGEQDSMEIEGDGNLSDEDSEDEG